MQIDTTRQSAFLTQSLNLLLYREYLWLQLLDGPSPASVKVESNQVAPKVAVYHTIHVDHRKDSELILAEQPFNFGTATAGKSLKYLFHNE